MKLNKRSFLKFMGGAVAGGKQTAEAVAREVGLTSLAPGDITGLYGAPKVGALAEFGSSFESPIARMAKWVARNGLPGWKMQQLRESTREVHALDPDIAALKSFSMTVKIGMQRQRQYEDAVARVRRWPVASLEENAFNEKHGFWL